MGKRWVCRSGCLTTVCHRPAHTKWNRFHSNSVGSAGSAGQRLGTAKEDQPVNEGEFKIQVLETVPQWSSGLWRRLKLDADGISLFASPAFDSWLAMENWSDAIGDIVVDRCGQ